MYPKPIRIAYSPDTDDAFMVLGLRTRAIDWEGYKFEFLSDDIQALNATALACANYEVTAISTAAYPALADKYALMPVGSSVGNRFGPAIVVAPNSSVTKLSDLAGRRVAVPGLQTSAYFAARALLPDFTPVPLPFYEIGPAVLNGTVDAGILIHELQLNCEEQGFRKLNDLGTLWFERFELPLPLGANAIRRDLGNKVIEDITRLYRQSIEWAMNRRSDSITTASELAKAGLSAELADRYIEMYVNQDSLTFSEEVVEGMEALYASGAEAGLCPPLNRHDFLAQLEG